MPSANGTHVINPAIAGPMPQKRKHGKPHSQIARIFARLRHVPFATPWQASYGKFALDADPGFKPDWTADDLAEYLKPLRYAAKAETAILYGLAFIGAAALGIVFGALAAWWNYAFRI